MYTRSLTHLIDNPSDALPMSDSWEHYLASDFQPYSGSKGAPYIEPLVTTTWTQEKYYNAMCPYNPASNYVEDGRAVTGAVALNMANILYYYRYPEHGSGAFSYTPYVYDYIADTMIYMYPTQTVDYGQATYDYNAMPNSLSAYSAELAKLIYHCGVAVRTYYGAVNAGGSSASSWEILNSLKTYYSYSNQGQIQQMSEVAPSEDLMYLWVSMAKAELDAHRPICYAGSGNYGGHAWIVDGYTTIGEDTYFHVNFGWNGYGNGFFLINHSGYSNAIFDQFNSMMIRLMPDSAAIQKPAQSFTRVTSSFGTISDGAGNMKYAQNSNRRWVLACPNATAYRLHFSKLKVKSTDRVIVYNGGTESSGIKAQYSGNYLMAACNDYSTSTPGCQHADYSGAPLPAAITVNSDSVLIVFTSTANSVTDYGFVLDYEVTGYSKSTCEATSVYTDFTAVFTDKPNNAISDDDYRASSICEYDIKLNYCDKLVYAFQKFDLKEGDFVDIYNQTSSQQSTRKLIAHYDVHNPPVVGEVFEYDGPLYSHAGAETSRYLIRFASDNKIQGSGFQLTYFGIQTSVNNYQNVDIQVYPNPASSYVNVQVSTENAQQFKAEVVDMMGKTVYLDQFNHNGGQEVYQIPVNNLAKGVYFLHLTSSNGSNIQKFIVR